MSFQATDNLQPNANKRKRLSTACDRCRRRKVRCDDAQPVCSNCLNSGVECITTNPRQPDVPAQRRQAQGSRQKRVRKSRLAQTVDHTDEQERSPELTEQQRPGDQGPENLADTNLLWTPDGEQSQVEQMSLPSAPSNPSYTLLHGPSPTRTQTESWTPRGPDTASEMAEGAAAEPLPSIPRITSGNSLVVLTQWLDLAFARLGVPDRFSRQYRNSNTTSSTSCSLPASYEMFNQEPNRTEVRQSNIDNFLATTNQVFPILSADDVPRILTMSEDSSSVTNIFYQLVLVAGSSNYSIEASKYQSQVLDAALMRLVQIMRDETVRAINTLLLMSLLSSSRDEPEIAWHMLTTAVARAIAVGLDRRSTSSEKLKPQHQSRINTWWSLFVLDKVLAIELQRPPMIRDCFHDQEMPLINCPSQGHPSSQNCFLAIIDLAKIQEKVLEALLRCSRAEASGRLTLYEAVNDKMRISGELDQLLATWAERLPFDLKPSEYPACDAEILPAVSFLAMQYHQTMFLLHRNALIINPQAIKTRIDEHFAQASWRHRVLKGTVLCGNIARSIVHILGRTLENNFYSILNSIYAPLISVYALAIVIIKSPASESARVDLEIQASAIRMLERVHPLAEERSSTIHSMVRALHFQLRSRVKEKTQDWSLNPALNDRQIVTKANTSENTLQNPTSSLQPAGSNGFLAAGCNSSQDTQPDITMDAALAYETAQDFFDDNLDFDAIDLDAFALAFDLPS